jgi:predicted alpha/beta hydrolase family esterase
MNVILIHGCPSDEEKAMNPATRTYDKHWLPWIKKELLKRNIKVDAPLMPEPWKPNYNSYKKEFEKHYVDEESVLIGHSCGCAFLVRWLGESKKKVDKLILVAPWKIADRKDGLDKDFYEFPIDKSLKSRVGKTIMFTADDEEEDGKKSLEMYQKHLGGKIIELKGHGHFTLGDMGTEQFPELLDKIIH